MPTEVSTASQGITITSKGYPFYDFFIGKNSGISADQLIIRRKKITGLHRQALTIEDESRVVLRIRRHIYRILSMAPGIFTGQAPTLVFEQHIGKQSPDISGFIQQSATLSGTPQGLVIVIVGCRYGKFGTCLPLEIPLKEITFVGKGTERKEFKPQGVGQKIAFGGYPVPSFTG